MVRAALKVAQQHVSQEPPEDLEELAAKALAQAKADRARRIAENRRRREAAAEAARRSVHSFGLLWEDMEGWTDRYDPIKVGQELSDAKWDSFERTIAASVEFANAARTAREQHALASVASA